jgi:hypothetical protein
MTIVEYDKKMRSLADDMVVEGRTLEEEELVEYTLTGFSHEYDPIVSVVIAKIGLVFVHCMHNILCLKHASHSCAGVRVSDYKVIQDVKSETYSDHVSHLASGTSRFSFLT